jgi:beta-glucanase (GH16 family)
MPSHGSSAFWFYYAGKTEWTEIDVFEIGAGAPGFEHKDFITLHVQREKGVKNNLSSGKTYLATGKLDAAYHIYGLDWDEKYLHFFFDGKLVRSEPNKYWRQALTLNLDSETMPQWWGLPTAKELPSTFSIQYVHAWKKPNQIEPPLPGISD